MTETLLAVNNLVRKYGSVRAVDDLSFEVEAGRIVGFIGPNGAGKTTTMRIAATLDLPDSGDVIVNGDSVLVEPRRVRRCVGFMSDQFAPYPGLDVLQFLDFFARAQGLTGKTRLDRVRSVASFCGLDTFSSRPASGLSKGMGQRLHLAKTLLHDPKLLILDEPASGLDPRARIEFRELICELTAHGKSVLISSHILAELSESCDDVVVLEQGKLIASGSIADVAKGVQRDRVLEVRVIGEDGALEAAQKFFLVQPDVHDLEVLERTIVFGFKGDDEAAADLLARSVNAGHRLVQFSLQAADLEDIFMRMTQGRLQ